MSELRPVSQPVDIEELKKRKLESGEYLPVWVKGSDVACLATDKVYIKDSEGNIINPATEDTLSLINSKITKCDTDNVKIINAYDSTTDEFKVKLAYDARDRNWTLSKDTDSVTISGTVDVGNWPSFTFDTSNYLYIDIGADSVGLAKDSTLASELTRIAKVKYYDSSADAWKDWDKTITVDNFPSDYPDSTAHSKLDTINSTLQTELTRIAKVQYYDGTNWVDWDKKVTIDNFPSEYPLPSDQVSDLKNVTIAGSNIAYDSTNDKLKVDLGYDARDRNWNLSKDTDSVTVSGSVNVGNFPSDYPDSTTHSKLDTIHSDLYDSTTDKTAISVLQSIDSKDFATESTLSSIDSKITKCDTDNVKIVNSTVAYDSTNDRLKISVENDAVGLAKDSTLSSIDSKITKCDTDNVKVVSEVAYDSTNDLKKVSIERDNVGLAKESTLSGIKTQTDKLSFDASNNLKINISASDTTVNVNVTNSSISVDDGGGSLTVDGTVNVGNFPNWFTNSTAKTDDISTGIDATRQFFAHVYKYTTGHNVNLGPAGLGSMVWWDDTEVSVTATSWTTINRSNLGATVFMHIGVQWSFHGDGSNTIYVRVRDRNGHIVAQGSTTSSTYVTQWRRGCTFWTGYPDSDWIFWDAYVDSGTGYVKKFSLRVPFQNHNVVFGWNWGYTDQHGLYPWRVDASGYGGIFPKNAGNIAHGSVTVGTSATQIVGADTSRVCLIVFNNSNNWVYLGGSGVTKDNGLPLPPKSWITLERFTGALYGIASADSNVRYLAIKY